MLNLASNKFKTQTASHEVLHGLNEHSKIKIYRTIENTKWFKDNAEKIIEQYKKAKPNETQDYYNEEVDARFMEDAIDNPKYLLQQIEGDTNLLTDIVNHFKVLKKFENTFSKEDKQALNTSYNIYKDDLMGKENRPYKLTEARRVVDETLAVTSFGENVISIYNKGKVADAIYKSMNNTPYQERESMAERYANFIVNNAFSTNIELLDSLENQRRTLYFFKNEVRRKIDLTSIADEIKYKYDKSAGGIMLAWSKKGEMGIDKFAHDYQSELAALGINIESNNSADIFFELYDKYNNAKKDIANATKREISKVYSSEEIANIKSEIKEQVLKAYETQNKIDGDLEKLIRANLKLKEINNKLCKKY